jgi:hypothetical protein
MPRILTTVGYQAQCWIEMPNLNLPDRMDNMELNVNVYNSTKELNCHDQFFMGKAAILECLKSLKAKNSKGFDCIPQKILVDGADILLVPLTGLFVRVYSQRTLPDQ